jgi:hypothetical protein
VTVVSATAASGVERALGVNSCGQRDDDTKARMQAKRSIRNVSDPVDRSALFKKAGS